MRCKHCALGDSGKVFSPWKETAREEHSFSLCAQCLSALDIGFLDTSVHIYCYHSDLNYHFCLEYSSLLTGIPAATLTHHPHCSQRDPVKSKSGHVPPHSDPPGTSHLTLSESPTPHPLQDPTRPLSHPLPNLLSCFCPPHSLCSSHSGLAEITRQLSQGLCTSCSFCWECSSPGIPSAPSPAPSGLCSRVRQS